MAINDQLERIIAALDKLDKDSDPSIGYGLTVGDRTLYIAQKLEKMISEGDIGGDIDPEVIAAAVAAWIEDHPEVVTTVQDGAISYAKLDSTLKGKADDVSDLKTAIDNSRVTSLDATPLASGAIIEAVGIPVYVEDVTDYAAYGLTETGWYLFVRIAAKGNVVVSAQTTVSGAAGYIATVGAAYVDAAVKFGVASVSQPVTITWSAGNVDTFVFKATDLAIRNLDYRVTFYVYDAAPFANWAYAFTADATFQANKVYYTEAGGVYAQAEVQTVAYVLTADATFQSGKTYYTEAEGVYTAAEVTTGEAVPEGTYYEQTTVAVPAYYIDVYTLTADATFQANKTYYTEDGGAYTAAEVTEGEEVPAETYYEHSYAQASGAFADGVTYYTKSGAVYTAAEVTAGEAIPAYYNHSKVTFAGLTRNVTYKLDEIVDCPMEFVLPEIEDETHGCWFEIRLRNAGTNSMNLVLEDNDAKIATEHTQAEKAGINMINLHYTAVAGEKLWRFMNTNSTIPAEGGASA